MSNEVRQAHPEPVAYLWEHSQADYRQLHFQGDNSELPEWKVTPLYAAPPVQPAPADTDAARFRWLIAQPHSVRDFFATYADSQIRPAIDAELDLGAAVQPAPVPHSSVDALVDGCKRLVLKLRDDFDPRETDTHIRVRDPRWSKLCATIDRLREAAKNQQSDLAASPVEAPAAREADSRWRTGMPEEAGIYIVWLADPMDTGWAVDRAWTAQALSDGDWDGCPPLEDGCEITHWMPLPAAPSGVPQDSARGDHE
jgi:hypothetical protein